MMRALSELPEEVLTRIQGVFCDIDDTLTTHGKLTAQAYDAMEALQRAGFRVIPITGRPAGWCDHIARMWPVDAVVGENGAFYFAYDRPARKLLRHFLAGEDQRRSNRDRLIQVRERILREVPGADVASDQAYREADLAIDFCEDVPHLADADIDRIVAIMQEAGMNAKLSSIHVNGWFGDYDKLGMTKTLMRERFDIDLDRERDRFIFVGDSPNDAPMFDYFPHSVGVANVVEFAARLSVPPKFVTNLECGQGFAELAAKLISASRANGGRS